MILFIDFYRYGLLRKNIFLLRNLFFILRGWDVVAVSGRVKWAEQCEYGGGSVKSVVRILLYFTFGKYSKINFL